MLRALRIVALIAFVAIAAVAGVYGFLFWTPTGRATLIPFVESKVGQAFGGEAKIGALKGDLPGGIIIENLRLGEQDTEWLAVELAELRWKPFALLRGSIDIQSARIEHAQILAAPPARADEEQKLRGFELPQSLPSISIGQIELNDVVVSAPVAGSKIRLDGGGAISMGGPALAVNFNLTSSDDRDFATVRVVRNGDTLDTEIVIASKTDGALAQLSRLGGALYLEANGAGPLANYRLDINTTLGGYGALRGVIGGDFGKMTKVDFDLNADLGERLANTKNLLGSTANVAGEYSPKQNGGAVTISEFHAAFGDGTGAFEWRNNKDILNRVRIEASANLTQDWRPDIRRYIGDQLEIEGEIRPVGELYSTSGRINASLLNAVLQDVETDLKTFARGPATITVNPNGELPEILSLGADVSGKFDLRFSEGVSAKSLRAKSSDGGEFSGDASYAFDSGNFSVKGDATLEPAKLKSIAPNLRATRNISAVVDIKGAPDSFGGAIVATTPEIFISKSSFPAARSTLAFADAPSRPSGQITARTIDGARNLKANFAKSPGGSWRVGGLDYVGRNFALKGSAALDPQKNEADIDLAYRGTDNAEPWPGVRLVGDLTVKGAIASGVSSNRLALRSASLRSGAWSLGGFSAVVKGPSDNLSATATAAFFNAEGVAPLTDIAAEVRGFSAAEGRLSVTKFDAVLADAAFSLTEPTQLTISDGIAIRKFRASIGHRGSAQFDGQFQKNRWQGIAKVIRAPIVGAASVIDFNLDLDTDRKAPASGDFLLTSLISKTETASLSGEFNWNGNTVSIRDGGRSPAFHLNLSVPARLTKSPSMSIETNGQLVGTARYEGRVETVAGFLPVALQTLEGALVIEGKAAGTLADPELSGALTVTKGAYTELASGLNITNVDATARASRAAQGSVIEFDAAGSGAGQTEKTVLANGAVTLGETPHFSSKITLKGARFSAGPVSEVETTGAVDISGPFDALLAEGDITVRRLDAQVFTPETTGLVDINVVALNGDGATAAVVAESNSLAAFRYNIHISGDDRIFVRGRGLESEWRADVKLTGRADAPVVFGDMSLRKGEITFAGRRFDMTRGDISFDRLSANNPSLDLHAERKTQSGTVAAIDITGRARTPKIVLVSTPALPPEDIMALILFDKPASELSAIESLQVAEGLAELGGIGPFGGKGLTGSARQALGLDLLNIDIDQANSAASSLTVGKYVADGLFVSAKQDARGQSGAVRIEYEINDSFTVQTEIRQDGDQTVSANWKRDF